MARSRHRRLLLINLSAGSATSEAVDLIRGELSDFHYHEYHKRLRVADLLTSEGTVVVAGGDGL